MTRKLITCQWLVKTSDGDIFTRFVMWCEQVVHQIAFDTDSLEKGLFGDEYNFSFILRSLSTSLNVGNGVTIVAFNCQNLLFGLPRKVVYFTTICLLIVLNKIIVTWRNWNVSTQDIKRKRIFVFTIPISNCSVHKKMLYYTVHN